MIAISALGQDTTTTNASLVLSEGVSLLTDRPIHTLKHGEPALGGATDSVLCSRTRNQARHSYIRQSVCLLPAACWRPIAASSRQQATRQVQVSAQLCVCVRVCVCVSARAQTRCLCETVRGSAAQCEHEISAHFCTTTGCETIERRPPP